MFIMEANDRNRRRAIKFIAIPYFFVYTRICAAAALNRKSMFSRIFLREAWMIEWAVSFVPSVDVVVFMQRNFFIVIKIYLFAANQKSF